MSGRDCPQRGHALLGAKRALAQGRGTLVEQDREAAPGRCARPAGRGMSLAAPGTPGCGRAGSSIPAAVPRPAASAGAGSRSCRSWRVACGRGRTRCRPARPDAPRRRPRAAPPRHTAIRAPLGRERDIIAAVEPGQPGPQVLPVGRADLAAAYLPGHGAGVVAGLRRDPDLPGLRGMRWRGCFARVVGTGMPRRSCRSSRST
jgi:hypothetical protein